MGSIGKERQGGKGHREALLQDCRQTDNHPDCLSVTDSPHPKLPSRYPPQSCGHAPSWNYSFCLPPPPEELALRRGVSAACVCQRPSPWVLLRRYLGPCYGMNTAPDAREPGRSGQEQPPHSHTLGSELAWFLPSCRMTSRLEGDTQCLSIPGVGGKGRCWDP